DLGDVERLLERYPRRRGTARLRKAIRSVADSAGRTRSELEGLFVAVVRRYRLPVPELNVVIDLGSLSPEVDAVWIAEKLIVELEGGPAHGTAAAFEHDRALDRALALAEWRADHEVPSDDAIRRELGSRR